MLSRPLRLALVDDHVLFRKTLQKFLSEQHNISISHQAGDVFELMDNLKRLPADILIMDIFLPKLNGNDALKMIRDEYPAMKILVLSMSTDMDIISDLLEEGIHGYISKSDDPDELLRAIQAVSENRLYRNLLFTEALYWNKQNNITVLSNGSNAQLNDREKRILQLIWEEKCNKEIADVLFLSTRSIEKIRQDLKEKLGVKSTVGLLKYAIRKKIVDFSLNLNSTADLAHNPFQK